MKFASPRVKIWLTNTARACVFFLVALLAFETVRLAFFFFYRNEQTLTQELPALLMGLRLDAKWFAIMLIPAWVLWGVSGIYGRVEKLPKLFAIVAVVLFALLDLINFGFYGFYSTPISSVIFGFIQDDTKAITTQILRDWPVTTYVVALCILSAMPCLAYRYTSFQNVRLPSAAGKTSILAVLIFVLLSVVLGMLCRGSFGTFPLRAQDLSVSTDEFINTTVVNGPFALNEANKSRKMLDLKGDVAAGLRGFGFENPEGAEALLNGVRPGIPEARAPLEKPHVVLAVMESMGRTLFEADSPTNNTLGRLKPELRDASVYRNGICAGSGTFPSLEGILFDTPYTPLTQSRYGKQPFPFSKAFAFRKAGYETVFLTSGSERWREISSNFPRQGYDRILGAEAIKAKYPKAETGTWGIGDAWMFRYADSLLSEADQKGKKLFIVMLSTTNHGPYKVPDGVSTEPVNPREIPSYVMDDRASGEIRLKEQTYQYAASSLGDFVNSLRGRGFLQKTIVAATGDHNTRLKFEPTGIWHYSQGVPLIFWVPESLREQNPRSFPISSWVSHRDLLPTIEALALGKKPDPWEGRALFSDEHFDVATSFFGLGKDGFAISNAGAASVDGSMNRCFAWHGDRLEPVACTGKLKELGDAARAQRALADYVVRCGALNLAEGKCKQH
ncbi:MAG: LTA synthase family protein [Sutterellaceae bacterium]|nr:LTA synthase family protein [Sutterellaceae bacterium]MDY2868869.1 LTA synthase family protein [Mesosutterella sp.]